MKTKLELKNISKYTVKGLDLKVFENEILTLLGASGSGKTTLLRIISGLISPDEGEVSINGNTIVNSNIFIPPEERKIGMVFQNYALFPHMNVEKNIAFGLRKIPKKEKKAKIISIMKSLDITGLEKRYSHELSGGQQQRVALARALITKPSIILFDEPFSSLDENLKDSLRKELKKIIKENKVTAIFVTHDKKDALSISDRIAVINKGKIEQIDMPEIIYNCPKTEFIASYFGKTNLLKAIASKDGYKSHLGFINHSHDDSLGVNGFLSIRPEWCIIDTKNHLFKGRVIDITYFGEFKDIKLELNNLYHFHIHLHREQNIAIGDLLAIKIKAPKLKLII